MPKHEEVQIDDGGGKVVTMPQKSSNTTNISALPDRELRSKWQTKRGATLDSKLAAININRNMKVLNHKP